MNHDILILAATRMEIDPFIKLATIKKETPEERLDRQKDSNQNLSSRRALQVYLNRQVWNLVTLGLPNGRPTYTRALKTRKSPRESPPSPLIFYLATLKVARGDFP